MENIPAYKNYYNFFKKRFSITAIFNIYITNFKIIIKKNYIPCISCLHLLAGSLGSFECFCRKFFGDGTAAFAGPIVFH